MSDVSQEKRQEFGRIKEEEEGEELSQIKKEEDDEFVHIKEEQKEYFIKVENPHIEEQQQQPHPLKGEDVKEEVSKWTGEPLKVEDGGPIEASGGAEPPSGGSSCSKEGSHLITQPSEIDNATSHSLLYFSKYLGPERQEPGSPGGEEDVEPQQIKEEEPESCQQKDGINRWTEGDRKSHDCQEVAEQSTEAQLDLTDTALPEAVELFGMLFVKTLSAKHANVIVMQKFRSMQRQFLNFQIGIG
ncbi:zinc finger and BTB domain-containing protein 47-like isoform X2 [Corythoichthys intestinalis]|uniref:zinc finger and BTB domain-containing protein 47-like isoform X2 n=1 Tax=Corythoichthys intestinalis TaxID=161448 RepID=UPI0025A5645A|nr:zinc finger and BTB domain-containing protein 47-like isoform X2 [Corythoichthys intestinalis]